MKKNKLFLVALFILIIVVTISCTLIVNDKLNLSSNLNNYKLENIRSDKIKNTSTLMSNEGIYITDVSEIVDEVMPSIVSITSKTIVDAGSINPFYYGREYTQEGAGSGVIISENDNEIFILTNYHVVKDTNELSVKFINDEIVDAKVKGVSVRKDIAVVSVDKSIISNEALNTIKIAKIGNSDELKVGNGIIAIGNALGYGQSVTTGIVSALNREVSTDLYVQEMIQIDAAINGGNSGGALLNSKGEVVGINSVKYSSNAYNTSASIEGMGFAIPISDVEDIIDKLIKGENDQESLSLGIEGYMMTNNLQTGFYVSKIIENGNAYNTELEIGNIIIKIDNIDVTSISTIKKVLNKKQSKDTITLLVKYPEKNEFKEKEVVITLK